MKTLKLGTKNRTIPFGNKPCRVRITGKLFSDATGDWGNVISVTCRSRDDALQWLSYQKNPPKDVIITDIKEEGDMNDDEFYTLLELHDWTFEYSDDHNVWRRGQAERDAIRQATRDNPYRLALYNAYKEYAFKGGEKPPRLPADPIPLRKTGWGTVTGGSQ